MLFFFVFAPFVSVWNFFVYVGHCHFSCSFVVVTISEVDVAAIFHDVLLTVHNRKTGAQKVLFSVLFWSTWTRNSYISADSW